MRRSSASWLSVRVVNGKVTIYAGGTNNDIIVADNISYANPGSNVLGLIANGHLVVACWEPQNNPRGERRRLP